MYKKRITKIASVLLSAVLMMQSGTGSLDTRVNPVLQVSAEEVSAEMQTQAAEQPADSEITVVSETQPPTEAQTQPPTEAQTQPPTEAQTQPPTEAQTQPPTEAQTQPPTEAQTQPPTEAQTQPPTEAQTQPPTEAQTQMPTEAQTQMPTEAQTQMPTEAEETERSARVNDGEKIKADSLVNSLNKVLPYLFAAEKVNIPDALKTAIGMEDRSSEAPVLQGTEGEAALKQLKEYSVKLANAKSSSDVEVLNLYADKNGKLDTAQLEAQFKNQIIDVTQKYFVVNIIADHADQDLDFSGFELVLSDERVVYKETTQPGDILYNFAAMDGDTFAAYEGTVSLQHDLQGTFLAPAADVNVENNFAGAVFAKTVTVADEVKELLHIVFVDGKTIVETETELSSETVIVLPEETESTDTEIIETEITETEITETEVLTELEIVTEELVTEPVSDSEEPASTEETSEESGETNGTLEIMVEESLETLEWYSADGIIMKVLLDDAGNTDTNLASAVKVEIKAGEVLTDPDGAVIYEKDAVVKSQEFMTETSADLGSGLLCSGIYYIDVTEVAADGAKYLDTARIYFEIDGNGNAVFKQAADQSDSAVHAGGASWNDETDELVIRMIQNTAADETVNKKVLTVSVTDSTDETKQISSAAFVLKDSSGKVLLDTQGYPLYYVDYTGAKAALNLEKLPDGTYYLSQIRTSEGYLIDAVDKEIQINDEAAVFVRTVPGEDGAADTKTELGQNIAVQNMPAAQAENDGTVTVTARTYYKDVLLTSEQKNTHYVALFSGADAAAVRISEVLALEYEPGTTETKPVTFAGLAQGTTQTVTYYLAETTEFGVRLPAEAGSRSDHMNYKVWNGAAESSEITFAELKEDMPQREQKTARVDFWFDTADTATYPETGYSYPVEVTVTKQVRDISGAPQSSDETFYFNIYRTIPNTSDLGEAVFEQPAAIRMDGAASASKTITMNMKEDAGEFVLREVNQKGEILSTDSRNFQYAVSYPGSMNKGVDGRFQIACVSAVDENNKPAGAAVPAELTIENRKMESLVKVQVEDADRGEAISGVTLVIKNKSGKVVPINGNDTFTSDSEAIAFRNILTAGETYYLSALQTPSGYGVAPDVAFTVSKTGETAVVLQYRALKSTDYKLTVTKQVYSGKYPLYAYDTTNGANAKAGAYTFYVALFADSARTQKVSDVQKVTVSGLGGTTVFKNLEKGKTYYAGETDQNGQLKRSDSVVSVKYANKGVVKMTDKSHTTIIQNSYNSLPKGYRYTGTFTITKKLANTSGAAVKATETFYAGIYRKEDYSDTPTIVKLDLKDASSVSVKRRIVFPENAQEMTYYIAEVDAQGKRITENSNFAYNVRIDNPTVVVNRDNASATIINQAKSTKATLYLTKKVYNGTTQQSVNATFYAGLFKDPEFTKPYTKPIALKLEGKSELTLKLSLNLGNASNVKIYIAEVDENGNVIKDEKSFGYEIKLINSTAEFTQDRREVQTILLNSMFGTATKDDWNTIFSSDGNDIGSLNMSGGNSYWGVSGNGDVSEAAQTGDETPILMYVVLMGMALVILAGGVFRRKRS